MAMTGMASRAAHKLVFRCSSRSSDILPVCVPPPPPPQRLTSLPFMWSMCHSLSTHGARKVELDISPMVSSGSYVFESGRLRSRPASGRMWLEDWAQRQRGFSSTALAANQLGMRKGEAGQEREHGLQQGTSVQDDWSLRLANENGFLSWCRNSYLTTVVGIAMMAEGTTPLSTQAAEAAIFVAGLNLTWGTYQYVYNLLRLRRRTGMSALGSLTYISMALLHLGLWFVACSLFLGYKDDADLKPAANSDSTRRERVTSEKGDEV